MVKFIFLRFLLASVRIKKVLSIEYAFNVDWFMERYLDLGRFFSRVFSGIFENLRTPLRIGGTLFRLESIGLKTLKRNGVRMNEDLYVESRIKVL